MPKGNKKAQVQMSESARQEAQILQYKEIVSLEDKQMISLRKEIAEESQKLDELEENRLEAEKVLENMESAYKQELENEIKEITPEIQEALDEEEEKREEAQELLDKLKMQKQEVSKIVSKVEESVTTLEVENAELRRLRSRNESKTAELEEKYAVIAQVHRQLDDLTGQMRGYRDTIDYYTQAIERRKNEDLDERRRIAEEQVTTFTAHHRERFDEVKDRYNLLCGRPASSFDLGEFLREIEEKGKEDEKGNLQEEPQDFVEGCDGGCQCEPEEQEAEEERE